MTSSFRALALVSTLALAACGGGGGGGTTTTAAAQQTSQIAITETNAKPVSASALDTAQNTSATRGVLPTGVQIDAADAGAPMLQAIAETARLAVASFAAANLPAGVAVNQTVNCALGGAMTISGNLASTTGISAGDSLSISASGCTQSVGGATAVLSGQMSMTFTSAVSSLAPPFHIVVNTTTTNFSVTTGGMTVVANGDVRLDWTASSSTSQTLSASGTTMSSRETINGAAHTVTTRNFSQTLKINGTTLTATVSATVETDSTKLGTGSVSYTISTPTPVVWNASTRKASAGVIKVVGANNSQVLITINADGTVTIQIDANGDGVFEKTITSTVAELAGLI